MAPMINSKRSTQVRNLFNCVSLLKYFRLTVNILNFLLRSSRWNWVEINQNSFISSESDHIQIDKVPVSKIDDEETLSTICV